MDPSTAEHARRGRRVALLAELLGFDLRQQRQARGWSQARLGEAIGVTGEAVRAYEHGKASPSLPTIVELIRWAYESENDIEGDIVAGIVAA